MRHQQHFDGVGHNAAARQRADGWVHGRAAERDDPLAAAVLRRNAQRRGRVQRDEGWRGVGDHGEAAAGRLHVAGPVGGAALQRVAAFGDRQVVGPGRCAAGGLEGGAVHADLHAGHAGGGVCGAAADGVDGIALEILAVAHAVDGGSGRVAVDDQRHVVAGGELAPAHIRRAQRQLAPGVGALVITGADAVGLQRAGVEVAHGSRAERCRVDLELVEIHGDAAAADAESGRRERGHQAVGGRKRRRRAVQVERQAAGAGVTVARGDDGVPAAVVHARVVRGDHIAAKGELDAAGAVVHLHPHQRVVGGVDARHGEGRVRQAGDAGLVPEGDGEIRTARGGVGVVERQRVVHAVEAHGVVGGRRARRIAQVVHCAGMRRDGAGAAAARGVVAAPGAVGEEAGAGRLLEVQVHGHLRGQQRTGLGAAAEVIGRRHGEFSVADDAAGGQVGPPETVDDAESRAGGLRPTEQPGVVHRIVDRVRRILGADYQGVAHLIHAEVSVGEHGCALDAVALIEHAAHDADLAEVGGLPVEQQGLVGARVVCQHRPTAFGGCGPGAGHRPAFRARGHTADVVGQVDRLLRRVEGTDELAGDAVAALHADDIERQAGRLDSGHAQPLQFDGARRGIAWLAVAVEALPLQVGLVVGGVGQLAEHHEAEAVAGHHRPVVVGFVAADGQGGRHGKGCAQHGARRPHQRAANRIQVLAWHGQVEIHDRGDAAAREAHHQTRVHVAVVRADAERTADQVQVARIVRDRFGVRFIDVDATVATHIDGDREAIGVWPALGVAAHVAAAICERVPQQLIAAVRRVGVGVVGDPVDDRLDAAAFTRRDHREVIDRERVADVALLPDHHAGAQRVAGDVRRRVAPPRRDAAVADQRARFAAGDGVGLDRAHAAAVEAVREHGAGQERVLPVKPRCGCGAVARRRRRAAQHLRGERVPGQRRRARRRQPRPHAARDRNRLRTEAGLRGQQRLPGDGLRAAEGERVEAQQRRRRRRAERAAWRHVQDAGRQRRLRNDRVGDVHAGAGLHVAPVRGQEDGDG